MVLLVIVDIPVRQEHQGTLATVDTPDQAAHQDIAAIPASVVTRVILEFQGTLDIRVLQE